MLNKKEWIMIRALKLEGLTDTAIALQLGINRKTVSKYKNIDEAPKYKRRIIRSKLDDYKSYILARLKDFNLTSYKIYEEIKKQGFNGKYGIVNKYVGNIKKELKDKAVLRFETLPGEQAQVDWGNCGEIYDVEEKRWIRLYCFLMVLGYSRMKYIEFFKKQDLQSFLTGHNNAFKYFNGYTHEILYDNLKSVVIKRKLRAIDSEFNKKFMDFAGYYGFKPILARPYKPNTKGKVENTVNYVKNNFIAGESFNSLKAVNEQALEWLKKVNENTIHSTTKESPIERFKRENLISIENKILYDLSLTHYRKVFIDCHFSFSGNFYSVPYKYAGKEVIIKQKDDENIEIIYRNEVIATHLLEKYSRGIYITKEEHLKGLKELRMRNSLPRPKKRTRQEEENNKPILKIKKNYEDVEKRDLGIYEGVVL